MWEHVRQSFVLAIHDVCLYEYRYTQDPIARQASTFTAVRCQTPEGAGADASYLCVCAACNELCCRLCQAMLGSTDGVLEPPLYAARKFLPSGTVHCTTLLQHSDFLPGALGIPAPRQAVWARPGQYPVSSS